MNRKFKASGLVLVALIVMAVSASAALAHTPAELHVDSSPMQLVGVQEGTHVFTTDPGTVTCTTATFAGELNVTTATAFTITPTYSGCTLKTIFGNIAVSVDFKTSECDYLFNASGHTEIVCKKAPNTVVVSGPGCTVTIPAQTIASGSTFTNEGSGTTKDITTHTHVTEKIKYSYSGFTCGSGSNTTNGSYTGTTTYTGKNSAGVHVGWSWTATVP